VRPLHIKLLRDIRRLWAQVLAIALVMAAGVTTLLLCIGAYDSLSRTRADYYEANRFADVFSNATRAPRSLLPQIADIPGVAVAEGRIMRIALVDIDGMAEPASGQLVSLPDIGGQALDRVYLRAGRLPSPDSDNEAAISERFALAHHFAPGSEFKVLMNGAQRTVTVTGIVLSPEFIYALGPGDLMPDDRRFGVVWMSERTLASAYGLTGAFNNLAVKLLPGASVDEVISQVDRMLAPYGGQGAYGRKDQLSHAFLDAELKQLRAISFIMPPIFLLVAAFLVNMTLTRMIALEREQVGLLKALGYSSAAIALHYLEFVALIAVIGTLIGFAAGTWLGADITRLYARYYAFPFLVFSRNPAIYAIAALVTLGSAMLGAVRAALGAARLPPAVAMSPPAPARYRKRLSGFLDFGRFVSQSVLIVARHLTRWPWRTAGGVLGVALAVGTLSGSLWSFGSTDFLIDVTFFRTARQDATISFTAPKHLAALYSVARLPGVVRAEPFRNVPVVIRHGPVQRRIAITGHAPGEDLFQLVDVTLRPVALPTDSLVISDALARILHVQTGDKVELDVLEGDRRTREVSIAAIVNSYIGLGAYMDIDALNRLVGEGAMISGADISVDPGSQDALFAALKATPSASFIALEKVSLQRFRETLAQNMSTMIWIYVSLGSVIAFGVIYNFARISLSEQGRELASLRVLGFSRAEVAALLLGEVAVVVLIAQPIGWLIGYALAVLIANDLSTDIYRVPLVIGPDDFAWASLVVVGSAVVSGIVVRRRIDRLDMIAVLKTRE
jgi:putative ABC transport system permease protein